MQIPAKSPDHYIQQLPESRKAFVSKLRETINQNLPKGFEECINYNMLGYVVPHSIYPDGYHCDTTLPLPFMNLASQKNYIALYHMGLYAFPDLLEWFKSEYPKHCKYKLGMGKSCIRFKKPEDIPFKLIGELSTKITVAEWIDIYENNIKR